MCHLQDSLNEFSSKFIAAEALERAHSFSECPKHQTVLDQYAEALQTLLDDAAAQDQAFKAVMEQIKKDQKVMISNRMKARQAKLSALSRGRQARIHLMKEWEQRQQHICSNITMQHNATEKLTEAIHHLPKLINKLDHLRMMELEGQIKKEEEEDDLDLKTLRKESSHLDTLFTKQNRNTLTHEARPTAPLKDTKGKKAVSDCKIYLVIVQVRTGYY